MIKRSDAQISDTKSMITAWKSRLISFREPSANAKIYEAEKVNPVKTVARLKPSCHFVMRSSERFLPLLYIYALKKMQKMAQRIFSTELICLAKFELLPKIIPKGSAKLGARRMSFNIFEFGFGAAMRKYNPKKTLPRPM